MKRALVLSLAVVMGLGIAAFAQVGELHGEWDTTITIYPNTLGPIASFLDFTTELTVTYSVGGWDFTSYSKLDDTGWSEQWFSAGGSFGAFTIGSKMVLGTAGTFTSWAVDTSFIFGSVDLTIDFDLVPNDLRLCVGGTASTGVVDITILTCFGDLTFDADGNPVPGVGGCDLDWAGVDITIEFPFCCADVTATLAIDCAGFDEACFAVTGIAIPNLPWVTVDAEVCFELATKTLTLTPKFDFGADVCFDLYICQSASNGVGGAGSPLTLQDIYVAGIGLECEISGVSFTGISFWGPKCASLKPAALGDYWEMYKIATTGSGDCCGPFNFDLSVFFDVNSVSLFDVAAFEANFSYAFGENFVFSMGFEYTTAAGLTKWIVGLDITW